MRLVTFRHDRETRIGAIVGEQVVDLFSASLAAGQMPLSSDMTGLLEMGASGLRTARATIRFAVERPRPAYLLPLRKVRLEAPVPCPRKFFALAGNYSSHLQEEGRRVRAKQEQTPRVFMKPPSTTANRPCGPIVLYRQAHWIDWEVELGVVIGRRAKYVAPEQAPKFIAGYTVVNDVSEREFKIQDRTRTEGFDEFFDWLNGKWPDGFAPMGPCLTTADEIPDPQNLDIQLAVNGKTMQHSNTGAMTYTCADIVSYISQSVTLEPGDIIAMGTPAGIGKLQGIRLKEGDVVRCEIERIGVLENKVVAEK